MDEEFQVFFPKLFDSAEVKEYTSALKKRTLLALREIQGKPVNESELEEIENFLFGFFKPKQYWGSDGEEVRHIRGFEQTCIVIHQHIPKDPRKMTVLEFYETLQFLRAQMKEKKKRAKGR